MKKEHIFFVRFVMKSLTLAIIVVSSLPAVCGFWTDWPDEPDGCGRDPLLSGVPLQPEMVKPHAAMMSSDIKIRFISLFLQKKNKYVSLLAFQ